MKKGSTQETAVHSTTPALNPDAAAFISYGISVHDTYQRDDVSCLMSDLPLPQESAGGSHPTLSLCAPYLHHQPTPLSDLSPTLPPSSPWKPELSPPPHITSPWKHELQSTCSEDSALHSDSDNIQEDTLVTRVRKQLEYYFSLENLATDQYLISQMDGDQFVPIWTVANFNAVKKLTTDIEVIKEALHSSTEVQIDSTGSKVRPVIKRCTLILRDISQHATPQEIAGLFNNSPDCPPCVKCTFAHNNSWFVEFRTEHEALQAYSYFREHPHYFHGHLIKVRIKAKPIQRSSPTDNTTVPYSPNLYQSNGGMPCYPMLPMMWMSPSGMLPLDMNYPGPGEFGEPFPGEHHPERFRIRSSESYGSSGNSKRKTRRNIGRSTWRNNEKNLTHNRERYNVLHPRSGEPSPRHRRNDSENSNTSASSYHHPPPPATNKMNNKPTYHHHHHHHQHQLNNKQTSYPHRGTKLNKPISYHNKGYNCVSRHHSNLKNPTSNRPSEPVSEKPVAVPKPPPEEKINLEPSQFPPLSENSVPVQLNNAWCKKDPDSPVTQPFTSATPTPERISTPPQRPNTRAPKNGPRPNLQNNKSDGFVKAPKGSPAALSDNWRRPIRSSRNMRPMRKSSKNTDKRENEIVPKIRTVPIVESTPGRPTYSEITAKLRDDQTSSEDDVVPKNTALHNGPQTSDVDQTSDSVAGNSDTEQTDPQHEEAPWSVSKCRNTRPRNLNNIYRLQGKLNDLDISEPVFPVKDQTSSAEDEGQVLCNEVTTPCNDVTTSPSDVITPVPRTMINWFEDDDENGWDDLNCFGENTQAAVGLETSQHSASESDSVQDGSIMENHVEGSVTSSVPSGPEHEALTTESDTPADSPGRQIEPEVFVLSECAPPPDAEGQVLQNGPSSSGVQDHDSEYDSERDEFFSSYCESPGWE